MRHILFHPFHDANPLVTDSAHMEQVPSHCCPTMAEGLDKWKR